MLAKMILRQSRNTPQTMIKKCQDFQQWQLRAAHRSFYCLLKAKPRLNLIHLLKADLEKLPRMSRSKAMAKNKALERTHLSKAR